MPPKANSIATATFYYRGSDDPTKEYWRLFGTRIDRRQTELCKDKALASLVSSMGLPPSGDLGARLRMAYDWVRRNIEVPTTMTAEEREVADDGARPAHGAANGAKGLKALFADRRGTVAEVTGAFVCVARHLGAEAYMALASNRKNRLFDASLLSASQFDALLVFLRPPGTTDETATFVDFSLGLAYGEVPWWLTGWVAFVADPKNPRTVKVRPADPEHNLSETTTSIEFRLDGTAQVRWTRSAGGQQGILDRLQLRRLPPRERSARLDEMCGASDTFEIKKAQAPGLDDRAPDLRLECDLTMTDTRFTEDLSSYHFSAMGPWMEWTPDLPAGPRLHPVVFDFPRVDHNVMEITAPPGFEPYGDPVMAPVQSDFGRYTLSLMPTETGYRVERKLTLVPVAVPASEYESLRGFLAEVRRVDATRMEFRRKPSGP